LEPFRVIAEGKGLEVDFVIGATFKPLSLDEGKMERALANLIGNAVKFTAKGHVTVETAQRGKTQEIRVSDTGPGVPPEFRNKLFTKFSRAQSTGAEGTGLGLSIAKGIVEAHGGTLLAEFPMEGGTVFVVSLPDNG
jgi:signal transduction histidine kinase